MNPLHYGVVVGIGRYPAMVDLPGAVDDADAFASWLSDPDGGEVPPENVHSVLSDMTVAAATDPFDARPVKREVDQALNTVNKEVADLAQDSQAWESSRLYLYVAGHGVMPGDGEAALLLADSQPGVMGGNVEVQAYLNWYRRSSLFREVIVFADCCRSFAPQVNGAGPVFDLPGRPRSQVFGLVGYSTALGRGAHEADMGRGYFTSGVIAGLRGGAPYDDALGGVTSLTLAPYVAEYVSARTIGHPYEQRVEMPTDAAWPIVLSRPAARPAYEVVVRFPAGFTAPVDLLIPGGKRLSWDSRKGDWRVLLEDGCYGVVLAGTYDGAPFEGRHMFVVAGGGQRVDL